ncbi:MAG: flavodoxin domain-containing protein [Elusimicrobia bacterium]|nr:flavodoxin domain-containing protein [Candidatus Liberimonas magnetica]
MKNLVVYYSYTGKTEIVAKAMASELNAELLKIDDVERPSKLKAYFSGAFAALKGKSWPINPLTADISSFDRIFVGSPVWCWKAAPEINSFFDQANLPGKSVVVFVTMGGSSPKEAIRTLSAKAGAKGAKVVSSFSIKTGCMTNEQIAAEAKEIAAKYR